MDVAATGINRIALVDATFADNAVLDRAGRHLHMPASVVIVVITSPRYRQVHDRRIVVGNRKGTAFLDGIVDVNGVAVIANHHDWPVEDKAGFFVSARRDMHGSRATVRVDFRGCLFDCVGDGGEGKFLGTWVAVIARLRHVETRAEICRQLERHSRRKVEGCGSAGNPSRHRSRPLDESLA